MGPIERAGLHLLDLLQVEGEVRSERFYDGTQETEDRLGQLFGIKRGEESAGLVMDWAVEQLEVAGLVEMVELPEELSDGTNDYRISLTDAGRAFLASGKKFQFRDVGE
jgi:hypothetical protein